MKLVERIQECDQDTAPVGGALQRGEVRFWKAGHIIGNDEVQALPERGFQGRRQTTGSKIISASLTGDKGSTVQGARGCLVLGCQGGLSEQLMFGLSPEQPRVDLGA